ncbi:telomere elongation protein [Babesia microti strain RI]|uniref:Telomere elongation protein n=1 Tax=Babesia microti (strain RI) TaxID=1133968 RepID=I7JCS7_BABMR|nr:telomere elongation protein [Babesia microti strain RI]CCF75420.1 telomere elongation protein [Babesia microti strain RI]|eukprot:XP_012649828.1 telomere elongation protein [Babesia microti strain RI]
MDGHYRWGDVSALNIQKHTYKHTHTNGNYKNPTDALALSFEASLDLDVSTRNNSISSNEQTNQVNTLEYMNVFQKIDITAQNVATDSLNLDGDFELSDISDLVGIINCTNQETPIINKNVGKLAETPENCDILTRLDKKYTPGEVAILNKLEKFESDILRKKPKSISPPAFSAFLEAEKFVSCNGKKSLFKLLAGHGVVGSFFGANGHRIQALQHEHDITVSVTTKRIHFPGSNNKGVLLFQGKLTNILRSLRPLYKAMQEETARLLLDDEYFPSDKIRLEIEVLVPESLRFTMDRNRDFKKIMETSGCNMRVIKQTYEDPPVQERVLVIFGNQQQVEIAIEKVALLIQDDSHLKYYGYMKYPDLTIAKSVYK